MSRAIIYSTFFILSIGVVLLLLVSFKVIKNPVKLDDHMSKNIDSTYALGLDSRYDIEHSWLNEVGNENSSKEFKFSKIEIELKLN